MGETYELPEDQSKVETGSRAGNISNAGTKTSAASLSEGTEERKSVCEESDRDGKHAYTEESNSIVSEFHNEGNHGNSWKEVSLNFAALPFAWLLCSGPGMVPGRFNFKKTNERLQVP